MCLGNYNRRRRRRCRHVRKKEVSLVEEKNTCRSSWRLFEVPPYLRSNLYKVEHTFLFEFYEGQKFECNFFSSTSFNTFSGVYILATFPPPFRGGEKIGTFGSLGKKIDPSEKKNLIVQEKI